MASMPLPPFGGVTPDEVEILYQSLVEWSQKLQDDHDIEIPPDGMSAILHLVVKNLIHESRQ